MSGTPVIAAMLSGLVRHDLVLRCHPRSWFYSIPVHRSPGEPGHTLHVPVPRCLFTGTVLWKTFGSGRFNFWTAAVIDTGPFCASSTPCFQVPLGLGYRPLNLQTTQLNRRQHEVHIRSLMRHGLHILGSPSETLGRACVYKYGPVTEIKVKANFSSRESKMQNPECSQQGSDRAATDRGSAPRLFGLLLLSGASSVSCHPGC